MSPGMRQFLGFILAGGFASIVNFGVFAILLSFEMNYLFASGIGYIAGIGLSYSINRSLVFRSRETVRGQFFAYMLAYVVALALQLILLEIGVRFGLSPLAANAAALSCAVVINFFVVRRVVFSIRSASRPS